MLNQILASLLLIVVFSSQCIGSDDRYTRNNVPFCLPVNFEDMWERDSLDAATKQALNLNVGEPRTVRLIYFLPNNRTYSQAMAGAIKGAIQETKAFFAYMMRAYGHSGKTFRFETDSQGEPQIIRVDGQYPNSHYLNDTYKTVILDEIRSQFDLKANIYLVVIDNGKNVIYSGGQRAGGTGSKWSKVGGVALVPGRFGWATVAHELGHAFGLHHDFRNAAYIMSYGGGQNRSLSRCNAHYLAVHPYFNSDIPIQEDSKPSLFFPREFDEQGGIIWSIKPNFNYVLSYPSGAKSVPIEVMATGSNGLDHAFFLVETREPHSAAGSLEVKECHRFWGVTSSIVQFNYDGVTPSAPSTSLSDLKQHSVHIELTDKKGNVSNFSDISITLIKSSPQLVSTLKGHRADITAIAFSQDGKTFASAGAYQIRTWDTERAIKQRQNVARNTFKDEAYSIAFSPDGSYLASGGNDNTIRLWDLAGKHYIVPFRTGLSVSLSIAFSPDGTLFASGGRSLTTGTIKLWNETKLWDISTREPEPVAILNHAHLIWSIAFSPDGTMLASGASGDGAVKLWDIATKEPIATLLDAEGTMPDEVLDVAFSPDGTMLASVARAGTDYHSLNLWDIITKQHIATLSESQTPINNIAFSPDGTMLASGAFEKINLWNVRTKGRLATLIGHTDWVSALRFSLDSQTLFSGSKDSTIRLWDVSNHASVFPPSFSLDGNVAAGDQAVTSLDVSPGSVVSIEVFGKDIQNADGVSVRFEYDATQVLYEGFDPGSVLPNAQVLSLHDTNPTAIEISLVSFGGQAAADSGLVGRIRFRTTNAFSGTTLRLMRAEFGRGGQRESITLDNTSVTLQLAALTADFNGDGRVDLSDFLLFVGQFGLSQGDEQYDAKYDLDGDGTIGFGDFLIFGRSFSKDS